MSDGTHFQSQILLQLSRLARGVPGLPGSKICMKPDLGKKRSSRYWPFAALSLDQGPIDRSPRNLRKLVFGGEKQKELRYDKINRDPYAADSRRPAAVDTGCKPSTFSALLRSYQATDGYHHSARLRLRAMVRRLELHGTTAKLPAPCRDDLYWQWHLSIAGWDLYWQYPTRDGHELLEQCGLSERISVWFFWRDNE